MPGFVRGQKDTEMANKRILFISWEGGMGHITRDVAIAREIHRQIPQAHLVWLASPLSTCLLRDVGEQLLPESALSADYNSVVPAHAFRGFRVNLMKFMLYVGKAWSQNLQIFKKVISKYSFDIVIGDEAYEIASALDSGKLDIQIPFVIIHDLIGAIAMTKNPFEKFLVYLMNRRWSRTDIHPLVTNFFVGELEDIPDEKFGFLLSGRREWARKHCECLGYVIRFDPGEYADKAEVRAELGYGKEPLVVCSLGGASVGEELLELCGRAYPILKKEIPDLRMVMVCGGLMNPESLHLPKGIDVRGYVSNLYEHFAASDLAVVVAGGTSTIELTALRRPFIYFPLERHFAQQILVSQRLARHRAGIRMSYYQTTPANLAEKIISNLGKKVEYATIPIDGAEKAAKLISGLLSGNQPFRPSGNQATGNRTSGYRASRLQGIRVTGNQATDNLIA